MLNEVRLGIRSLRKHPGFSLVVVTVLALGISATTAIFSVVNGVLLRPLSYRDSDSLVMIWGNFQKLSIERLTSKAAEYEDYRAERHVFEQVAAFDNQSFNLTGGDRAERVAGARVTANLFSVLGAEAAQGRTFATDEDRAGHENVVVLSHGLWHRRFGGNPAAVGQPLRLDDRDFTVVGVMPTGFQFPHASLPFGEPADLWLPLVYPPAQVARRDGPYYLNVLARLRADVSLSSARAEMNLLARRFEGQYRGYRGPNGEDGGWRITLELLREEAVGRSRRALLVLSGAVLLVLLIACANVANLLLVRASIRRKELAVRLALGASRWRLLRQLLIESLMLALAGGGIGLLVAFWGIASLRALRVASLPRLQEISVDGRVLGFAVLVTVVTALLCGVGPAWEASRVDIQHALKAGGAAGRDRRGPSWRSLLLVGEVALSLVLLIGAGLLANSFLRLQHVKPAVATERLLAVEIDLPASVYREPAQASALFEELVRRVGGLPGVQAVSVGTGLPLSGVARNDPFSVEGRPPDSSRFAGWQMVGADYFRTIGIPLVAGRDLTAQDMDGAAPVVAVVNESMARRYWPGENPLGRRIVLGLARPDTPWVTIVGIARDLPHRAIDSAPEPDWYLSRSVEPERNRILFVRTAASPSALAVPIRDVMAAIDRNQPVSSIRTMSEVVSDTVAPRRLNLGLFSILAGLAMGLAGLGIYGVMAYSVAQRTNEVGIRMALGAGKGDVLGLIIRDGMTLTLTGVVIGLAAAFVVTRLMRTLLFGVAPTDVTTFAAVSAFVILIALLACWGPARRAARLDPLVALRYE